MAATPPRKPRFSRRTATARVRQRSAHVVDSPFPWFGGKRRVAAEVWGRFGDVHNYVEPFFGSGAVLLGRPTPSGTALETVNDLDGFVANFWRAAKHSPDRVAEVADWPVNEADLHARHLYVVRQREALLSRLEADPDYHDPVVAGMWVWGVALQIGAGWASGTGPWMAEGGRLTHGVQGSGPGINRGLPRLSGPAGVHTARRPGELQQWFRELQRRLRRVQVACGDWARVCAPSVVRKASGPTAVLLDPPYSHEGRDSVYTHDDPLVTREVRDWCVANGDDPGLRIALCGYAGTVEMPSSWEEFRWSANRGYAGDDNSNRHRERIWFSPHCLPAPGGAP